MRRSKPCTPKHISRRALPDIIVNPHAYENRGHGSAARAPVDEVRLYKAGWCGFCRRVLPVFRSLVKRFGTRLSIVDLSDENDPRWESDRIEIVPTVAAFRGGREVDREAGMLAPEVVEAFVVKHLDGRG